MLSAYFVTTIGDTEARITFSEDHLLRMMVERSDYCAEIFLPAAKRTTNSSSHVIRECHGS
jgi:hypothetical protein